MGQAVKESYLPSGHHVFFTMISIAVVLDLLTIDWWLSDLAFSVAGSNLWNNLLDLFNSVWPLNLMDLSLRFHVAAQRFNNLYFLHRRTFFTGATHFFPLGTYIRSSAALSVLANPINWHKIRTAQTGWSLHKNRLREVKKLWTTQRKCLLIAKSSVSNIQVNHSLQVLMRLSQLADSMFPTLWLPLECLEQLNFWTLTSSKHLPRPVYGK